MKTEVKQLARELARELVAIAEAPKCEWITEEKTIEEFPFGKETLRKMRASSDLEFNHHWKYTKGINKGMSAGRAGSIIYHRSRMIEYVESI